MIDWLPIVDVSGRPEPPKPSAAVASIQAKAAESRQKAIALACDIAEGATPKDAEVLKVRTAADMSAQDFMALVATAQERKEASDAYGSRDFDAEIKATMDERREMVTKLEQARKEAEAARGKVRELHQHDQTLIAQSSSLKQKQADALNHKSRVLGKTGDRHDWRAIH